MQGMNIAEARSNFEADRAHLIAKGIWLAESVQTYVPEEFRADWDLACDAIPSLATDPSSSIPSILTTMVDPQSIEVLFAPNKAAIILGAGGGAGEVQKGDWTMDTTIFVTVEPTGETTSYGDYNENGRAGANTNYPQVQSYLFQTMKEYGERELDRAGLLRINWVSQIDRAANVVLDKFQNYSYFFGVQGLQCYGLLNNPFLSASLTPATKAAGGTAWIVAGRINATANEIYNDLLALFTQLVTQTMGYVDVDSRMVLALSPTIQPALNATNSFNVNVRKLLTDNFPNLTIETAVQYGALSATNPQGVAAGNLMQLIAPVVEGVQTGFAAYNVKARAHPIIRQTSSWRQKMTAGTWGTVLRRPFAVASMVGM
jgi:hypothetical protein